MNRTAAHLLLVIASGLALPVSAQSVAEPLRIGVEPSIAIGTTAATASQDGSFAAQGASETCAATLGTTVGTTLATSPCHPVMEPLVLSAVPEPSTLGMMLVGLGVVLGGLYPGGRKRRQRDDGSGPDFANKGGRAAPKPPGA